uniref:W2 domain-containing protein n=1 Tax=Hyaloperonospora arabidopsidis (strain Emoy2) TaxID=559515 RepID=M4BXE6_HYAAE
MRLNLARRGEVSGDVRASSSSGSRLSSFREGGETLGGNGGSLGRFGGGGRAAGRFARGSDDVSTSMGAIQLSTNVDEPRTKKVGAVPDEEPLTEKKLRAQQKREERKKKAEEERLAAEEAKRQALEEKKLEDEAMAQQAEKDRETMRQVLASGKKGEELAVVAAKVFEDTGRPSGAVLFEMVTAAAEDVAKSSANWIAMSAYGELLKVGMEGADKKEQMQALYALQLFLNKYDFPTGLLEKCFMALYSLDIIDEAGFLEHKYDVEGDVPGRMKAIVQTSAWLTWLETPEEESDEEAEE